MVVRCCVCVFFPLLFLLFCMMSLFLVVVLFVVVVIGYCSYAIEI